MKWLQQFFGINDREQRARTEEVSQAVHEKKKIYTAEMGKIQAQAKKVHEKTKRVHKESARLVEVVEGVTAQIARATGNNYE